MLSAESASGQFPVEAVRIMDRIIQEVEQDPHYRLAIDAAHPDPEATVPDAICCALRRAAGLLGISAAVTYTTGGYTSLRAARERPAAPILSMSADPAHRAPDGAGLGRALDVDRRAARHRRGHGHACRAAREEGFAKAGDVIAITAGMPFGVAGNTNLLKLAVI